MNRDGFSLVELLAVLTLMSLVMLMVTVRWNEPYQAARFQSDIERVIDADMKVRRHAFANKRPCRIIFDFENNTVQSSRWIDGKETLLGFKLYSTINLRSIQTASGTSSKRKRQIEIRPDGSGLTYALEINQSGISKWVMFAGRTGQPHTTDQLSDVKTLFKTIKTQRTDTH